MIPQDAIKVLKALADRSRILIINALYEKSMYVEEIAERLDLAKSTISFHLKKLEECKLVSSHKDQYYVMYDLKKDILSLSLTDIIIIKDKNSIEKQAQDSRFEQYRSKIINNFFEYGKLKTIPSQRKKRLIILNKIAESFEYDKTYTEREINIIIADFNDDFCTLRREMVDEKILQRDRAGHKYLKIKSNEDNLL